MNRRATLAPASVRGASTLASVRAALARASFMDARELRTRFATLLRINAGRMSFSVSKPKWNRQHILSVVDPSSAPLLREACTRMQSGDVMAAHRALAAHLVSRPSHWPLKGSNRERLAASINARFPEAAAEARDGADRILDGRIDLLGYRELRVGNPPAWNRDPVHRRQAPLDTYWADVRFLDPSIGDHKVIWELNRHQHFVTLGTAYWLTGDARYRTAFMQQLEDWVNANQPLAGVNWSSMLELAFRAMSWTWAVEFFAAGAEEDTSPWLIDLFVALDRQLSHVADNLSTYFSPNTHLTGEALALYAVSAAFPELRRSRERAATGRDILLREAAGHQVRPDGGHAELSAHYHRYSTDFYLLACLIARAIGDNAAPAFERAARCQAAYLRTIGDGTGRLPGTGDDDGGRLFRFDAAPAWDASSTLSAAAAALEDPSLAVASARAETFWILGEPVDPSARSADQSGSRRIAVWPSRMLADTGYFVSRSAGGGHLLFDGGPHGFLNGGHAHSDALSLVLTVLDLPLLVDPGTATYTMDPAARDRFRSARMHNTIVFDGRDPSQPAGPFRWRRRTDARFLVTRTRHDFDFAVAALAGRASTHMRAVLAVHGAGWMIVDRITPPEPIAADIWWHLHPMWTARRTNGGVTVETDSGIRLALAFSEGAVEITRDPEFAGYSSEYGRIETGTAICVRHRVEQPVALATFIPCEALVRGQMPEVRRQGPEVAGQGPEVAGQGPEVAGQRPEVGDQRSEAWRHVAFAVAMNAAEIVVELAFPDDPEPLAPQTWSQPCIQIRRARDAQNAREMTACVE